MSGGSRSRSGCAACRLRKKRCDETRPVCQRCQTSGISCQYPSPISGSFSFRFCISAPLEHYTLPGSISERHFINLNQRDVARLCLQNASCDVQDQQDEQIDLDFEAQVPRSVGNTTIEISEKRYLQYYMDVFSASRVYVTGDENMFCSLAMPFACTRRGPVMFTVLALSASEMAKTGIGHPSLIHSEAMSYYNSAIIELQKSISNTQDAEENILSCVLLSAFEATNGNRPAWLQHLNGAVAIYNCLKPFISQKCALFALRYLSSRWILLETTMPPGSYPLEEVVGDTSMTAQFLTSLNTILQQTLDARPSVAMQSIDNNLGCTLEFLQLVNRISTLSALRFHHHHIDNPIADEMSHLYSSTSLAFDRALTEMIFIARINDYYLEHNSQCFKLAGRVFLRLVCLNTTVHQTSLLKIQNELLQVLRLIINKDQHRRAFPMWPLFIAGCASFEDEHRKVVLDMFRILERKWPISNIHLVRCVTMQIWQSRDLNGFDSGRQHDWQKLITTYGWKLALS